MLFAKTTKQKSKKGPNKVKTAGRPMWQKALAVVFIVAFGTVGGKMLVNSFAATAPLYLSPSSQSVETGSTVTVDLRMSVSSNADSVTAKITYDPNVLTYVSMDASSSVFPTELLMNGGDGTININRGTFSPAVFPTGSEIVTVTFTAKTAATSSSLQLSGNVGYSGTLLNPGTSGATITVTDPAPTETPPPPTPTPTGDTKKPFVTIFYPTNGSKPAAGQFTVKAKATDNVGVVDKKILIDGHVVYDSGTAAMSYNPWGLNGQNVGRGAHTITVRATDKAGNVGSKTITVYR
jgi:hypothetical protein